MVGVFRITGLISLTFGVFVLRLFTDGSYMQNLYGVEEDWKQVVGKER